MMNTRRNFLSKLAVSAALPAVWCGQAFAQTPPPPVKLTETDPMAVALGYKEDTTKVDAAKYPRHKPEQRCDNCVLYSGKPGEASGPCSGFAGKIVTAAGWCSIWVKKPEPVKP
jgi:High potential iron-sulfur protein